MSIKALKSATRCPHCRLHMIPWNGEGESRYGLHVNSCPKKQDRSQAGQFPLLLGHNKHGRVLKPIDSRRKRENLERLGWEITFSSGLLGRKDNLLACIRCLFSGHFDSEIVENDCTCGGVMIPVKDVVEELWLNHQNLPKNF